MASEFLKRKFCESDITISPLSLRELIILIKNRNSLSFRDSYSPVKEVTSLFSIAFKRFSSTFKASRASLSSLNLSISRLLNSFSLKSVSLGTSMLWLLRVVFENSSKLLGSFEAMTSKSCESYDIDLIAFSRDM